jgi:arylsulfatase A-like enzyme
MDLRASRSFSRPEVRDEVIPVYMGLIKQIDDQLGRLFAFMRERGLFENTLIVFTSDHGDYLGDHWMGEKDLFHEPSVKIPLIVYDPSGEADAGRGSVCDELVESIDLIPTFLQALGADPAEQSHRLEGRSLVPFLRGGQPAAWRRFAISEYDYSLLPAAAALGVEPRDARLFMVADKRWKMVQPVGFRPMLYDLAADPNEFRDLGADPACEDQRQWLAAALHAWGLRLSQRTTFSDRQIRTRGNSDRRGILIGVWDESDVADELWSSYLGEPKK